MVNLQDDQAEISKKHKTGNMINNTNGKDTRIIILTRLTQVLDLLCLQNKAFNTNINWKYFTTVYLAPGIFDNTLVKSTPVKA